MTLKELLIGIVFFTIVLIIPGLFLPVNRLGYYLGLSIGVVVGILTIISIYISIDKSLNMDQKNATGYMKRNALFRIFLFIIVLVFAVLVDTINVFTLILGILTLKFSAFLQPLTHKLFVQNLEKRKVRE